MICGHISRAIAPGEGGARPGVLHKVLHATAPGTPFKMSALRAGKVIELTSKTQ